MARLERAAALVDIIAAIPEAADVDKILADAEANILAKTEPFA